MTKKQAILKNIFFSFCSWALGIFLILIAIAALENNIISSILFVATAGFILPPVRKQVYKIRQTHIKPVMRVMIVLGLFGAASLISKANMDANSPSAIKLSSQQENLYITMLKDDFEASLTGGKSLLKPNEWLKALSVNGKTGAMDVLKDFDTNEVAASQKYNGPWLIDGQIQSIDDSFSGAYVEIGSKSEFINFRAEIDDKNKAALYSKGNLVTFYCRGVEEIATFIYGKDCQDYDDWFKKNTTSIEYKTRDHKITNDNKEFALHDVLKRLRAALSQLPNNSTCYNAFDETCKNEIEKHSSTSKSETNTKG